MTSTNPIAHLVLAGPGVEAWGHIRPLCAFVSHVVLSRPIHVTLFTFPRIYERVKAEVARGFGPDDTERYNLVRVIALDNRTEGASSIIDAMRIENERYVSAFTDAYEQLAGEKPVTCCATNVEHPAILAPRVVVVDLVVGELAHIIHRINHAKAIGFCSGMASYGFLCFAPTERGGRSGFKSQAIAEAEQTGRPVAEVADEILLTFTGDVTQVPGLPKMYHWEHDPQDTTHLTKGIVGGVFLRLMDAYYEALDGMIITTPEVYEPHAITATKDWFAETSRFVWAIGPLQTFSEGKQAIFNEEAQSERSQDIRKHLDSAFSDYGEHSVLYIAFGSAVWPLEPEKLEAFIDVIIEKGIPFILSHASSHVQLSESLKAKVEESKLGLLTRWSPQQTILIHPALGWFVTHAGHNSTLEAIQSGVPLICWPFYADQPANTVNLTDNHDVAYELVEVRTGNGLKPRYRTGKASEGTMDAVRIEAREVLDKAFGEDGARKRVNVKKLQQQFNSAWVKGGSSHVDLTRFLDTL